MNIYEITEIENQIEKIAIENDGEIPDGLLQQLVEKQTESLVQIEKLCKYIRHLELFQEKAKEEESRIKSIRKQAENRISNIKKYLTPYVYKNNKIEAGIFKLSIRQSTSVVLADDFNDARFITVVQETKINKNDIKKAIKNGEEIKGAILMKHENLQIK
jgi:thiamine phosphate synthase YjbQ (UPF0047 family)